MSRGRFIRAILFHFNILYFAIQSKMLHLHYVNGDQVNLCFALGVQQLVQSLLAVISTSVTF